MPSAMILAAGFGTRLRPITDWFPKPLVPIGDRPAYQHIAQRLRSASLAPIVINAHHRAEVLEEGVPDDIFISREEKILGTAGGVAQAAGPLGAGDVLVWNGDIYCDVDIDRFIRQHDRRQSLATLLVRHRPAGEGTVGLSAEGNVVRLRDRQFGREVRGADYLGIMMIAADARSGLPRSGCLVGDWLLPKLGENAVVNTVEHSGHTWIDIGTPASFLEANIAWLRDHGSRSWISPGADVSDGLVVHDSVISADARVEGNGELNRCVVLPGAHVRGPHTNAIALPNGQWLTIGRA